MYDVWCCEMIHTCGSTLETLEVEFRSDSGKRGDMADERVCKQFMKACKLSGSEDATTMTRMCSRNIRRFFWDDVADLEGVDMRHCEEKIEKPNDGRDPVQGKGGKPGAKLHEKAEPNRTMENMNYRFRRPDLPKGMKHVFDLRHGKPIVIAKRDYGNLS
ncbi:hypothetical protein MAR_030237 [Mya arenaria]|uniref:Uncharacterized protein n=1 Tax=Mya arenaria TaxID=6604 RepID=A0ABY7DII7_MYAAR|nr:hypothetical protein MAR_030191 [Mya arenaria]WAQ97547.1 hypothetical protein MAR_030237 [Mya arenaria]